MDMLKIVQAHQGYDDEEMVSFQENPRTKGIVSKLPDLLSTRFTMEVIKSHGCGAQHKVGDKIYFDGFGCLTQNPSEQRICAFAISAVSQLIWTAQELIYADVDPNNMRLNRVGCLDVGVKCGGLGNVIFEFKAESAV